MGTSVCVGSSFSVLTSKRIQDAQGQCRLNGATELCRHHSSSKFSLLVFRRTEYNTKCKCALGCQLPLTKQASTGAFLTARLRKIHRAKEFTFSIYCVDNSGLEPVVVEKASEEDGSDTKISSLDSSATSLESDVVTEGGVLELMDTDDTVVEESSDNEENDTNGMLRQPKKDLMQDNWQLFASEEGARPAAGTADSGIDSPSTDDETGSDSETEEGPGENYVRRRKAEEVLPIPDSANMDWTEAEKEKVNALQRYKYRYESNRGLFVVEAMRPKHMNDTEELLVDSFAELMGGLLTYRPLLAITVKQYVRERYATLPHSVTLVGLYAPAEGVPVSGESSEMQQGYWVVAGTVEVSFSGAGHPDVPTPAPPPNSPYICNMAIKKEYRRRGLGREMLKAAENLALSMGYEDMYLHVRLIDIAPLTMYKEAGYQVVSTDSLLSVLTFQRRRHLMRKRLSRTQLVLE
ncbi:uncharacterized protein [Physcomitrium patens]|uniref:N-acetyltransferase domain-containing protein n=1 Tax=Physcomitrium patens TaxID=3218 RepID=A0A2K1L0F6_PHYPA|nr:uncharacterized protein LOC112279161 [Physcomitrium patens]PNR59507.1 hypothetical protein PHYPA_002298 [Physcomitrium patens]|eukprot:XP_024369096.1 uncharacterized protein LOC112279161 [Physcomitrella patens]